MAHPAVRWKLILFLLGFLSLIIGILELVGYLGPLLSGTPEKWNWTRRSLVFSAAWVLSVAGAWTLGRWVAQSTGRKHRTALERLFRFCESVGMPASERPLSNDALLESEHLHALADVLETYSQRHLQMLEDLRKSNGFLYSIIKESPAPIYIMDIEGRIIQVNPAFESLYGYSGEGILESHILPERLSGETEKLIQHIQSGSEINGYETFRRTSEGKEVQVSLTISPIRGDAERLEALAVISRNITERKETEEKLRRSEKLSVVGQLAAGVAHEIRNPLTTLRGFVQLFRQRDIGKPVHLDLMLEELDRINLIVSEFIVLAKPHLNQYLIKDVKALLQDMIRIMEPQAHLSNIILETRFDEGLPKIRCEENQLKQAFLNIIKNGMEAMPGGGVISLEARRAEQDCVLIRIRDQGTGIPEEVLSRLGEPFVTSKDHGTGLGIMISQQILANHRGQMIIRSEWGKGTCVDILLPEDFERWMEEAAPAEAKAGKTS
ncbi:ATP-binding protein [Gorillibacterium sp. sgz5001074]|uniref:ATP-binding protein n=1 Tax=Gorillibacterium sp. sgz5001074 TaxID=3446695 RepID=UPI003F66908D